MIDFKLGIVSDIYKHEALLLRLRRLAFKDGHFLEVMYRQGTAAIIAYGPRSGIYGWSAAYMYENCYDLLPWPTIGVFVHPRFRHRGLGTVLKRVAIQEQIKLGYKRVQWQDKHTRRWYEEVIGVKRDVWVGQINLCKTLEV